MKSQEHFVPCRHFCFEILRDPELVEGRVWDYSVILGPHDSQ